MKLQNVKKNIRRGIKVKKIVSLLLVLTIIAGMCGFTRAEASILGDLGKKLGKTLQEKYALVKGATIIELDQAGRTYQNVIDYRNNSETPRVLRETFKAIIGKGGEAIEGVVETINDFAHNNVTSKTLESFFKAWDKLDSFGSTAIRNAVDLANDYKEKGTILGELDEDSYYFQQMARIALEKKDIKECLRYEALAFGAETTAEIYALGKVTFNTGKDYVKDEVELVSEVMSSTLRLLGKAEIKMSENEIDDSGRDAGNFLIETGDWVDRRQEDINTWIDDAFDYEKWAQFSVEEDPSWENFLISDGWPVWDSGPYGPDPGVAELYIG